MTPRNQVQEQKQSAEGTTSSPSAMGAGEGTGAKKLAPRRRQGGVYGQPHNQINYASLGFLLKTWPLLMLSMSFTQKFG